MNTLSIEENQIIKQIQEDNSCFPNLPIYHQVNDRIAEFAIIQDGMNIQYLAQKQRGNRDFAIKAIKSNPNAWFCLTMLLQRDEEIAYLVLESNCDIELLSELNGKFIFRNQQISQLISNKMEKLNNQTQRCQTTPL